MSLWDFVGDLVSDIPFIGDVVNGFNQRNLQNKNADAVNWANAQNIQMQRDTNEANLGFARETNAQNVDLFTKTMDFQNFWNDVNIRDARDAAKNTIQWRVDDAKAAGVHPLYALGAPAISMGGQAVGVGGTSLQAPQISAPSIGNVYTRQMGQNINRARMAGMSKEERAALQAAAFRDQTLGALAVDKAWLENDLLRSQIARLNRDQAGTPVPLVSGAKPGETIYQPSTPVVGSPGQPAREPAAITDYQYRRRSDGGIDVVMSADTKQRMEDEPIGSVDWWWRNRIAPSLGFKRPYPAPSPKDFPLPKGKKQWKYNWWRDGYFPE